MRSFTWICLFVSTLMWSQEKCVVNFLPEFNAAPLEMESRYYPINKTDSLQIETLRFYISGVQLLQDDHVVYTEQSSFHLIDASAKRSLKFDLPLSATIKFNRIKFYLGVDSLTNVSGAMEGELDPTKGMYWTWQSGYINFKLEGKSNLCKTRNNFFEFHLGGYLPPHPTLQEIVLKTPNVRQLNIHIEIQKFIEQVNLRSVNQVMSPGAQARELSAKAASCFFTRTE